MVYIEKPQCVKFLKTLKTLDFTRLKGIFSQKI